MANAHMSALNAKHAQLEARISQETMRPHPDNQRLAQLKKEKLRLKEELSGLRA